MKIAIVRSIGNVLKAKTYNSQEIGLATALCKYHNVNVDIYTAGYSFGEKIIIENGNNKVRQFSLPFITLPKHQSLMPRLFREMSKNNYDLVQIHEYNFLVSLQTIRFCKKNNIKSLILHGPNQDYEKSFSRIIQNIYDYLFLKYIDQSISSLLVKTTATKEYLTRKGFKRTPKVCPIGLDVEKFDNRKDLNWNQITRIPKNSVKIVYVGNIQPSKNIDFLIDVFSRLSPNNEKRFFLFVGKIKDFEYKNKLDKLIQSKKLENNIIFLDVFPQENLPSLFEYCDLKLYYSNTAIYGMALMEAMYFGLPAIANNLGGFKDIIVGSEGGVLVDSNQPEEWAKIINDILSDKLRLVQMGQNARKHITENFVWGKVVDHFYNAYTEILHPQLKSDLYENSPEQ